MTEADFCARLVGAGTLSSLRKALAILCWDSRYGSNLGLSATEIVATLRTHRLGNPNVTTLKTQLSRDRRTHVTNGRFHLTAAGVIEQQTSLLPILGPSEPAIDHSTAYLPDAIWLNTRGYLERVCRQLNGSYANSYFDAASVMLRRAVETLIIEAFEKLNRATEIQGADGNYLMLGDLVTRAISTPGLTLGRDSKRALKEIKALGDRAAHNRRFNAGQTDLDEVRTLARVCIEDLIHLADLRRP